MTTSTPTLLDHPVIVIDLGGQYSRLIARRVRDLGAYSEVVHRSITATQLAAREPAAIILSGGPASVYEPGAPQVDPAIFDLDVPLLGICYGMQLLARELGGEVAKTGAAEYGGTQLLRAGDGGHLLDLLEDEETVWMSHRDAVTVAPPGSIVTATTSQTPIAGFEDAERPGLKYAVRRCSRPRAKPSGPAGRSTIEPDRLAKSEDDPIS